MPSAIVVGAGVGGLGTALALHRRGWSVQLLERDATPLPATADEAFAWDRTGAPQVRHSHAFLARLRNLLRDRHPDVLASLLEAGATELRFVEMLPEELEDRAPRPGDEDLVALACRRTTFEWVLRRLVVRSPDVVLEHGVAVEGLLAEHPGGDGAPRVTGVRTSDGERRADVVVVANGRRSSLPAWLDAVGAVVDEDEEDTGIVYLSRFYRLAPGSEAPPAAGPIGGDLGYLKFGVFPGDDRTFSITFAVPTGDRSLRAALADPERFEQAAQLLTATRPWIERAGDRLTEVQTMAGLLNRQRRFVTDGVPVVLGLHAVGDAHTASNPLYGRGCSLALVMAEALADALEAHGDDAHAAALAYEAAVDVEVAPWYRASVTADRQARRHAAWLAERGDGTVDDQPPDDPDAAMAALLREGLLPAVRADADVARTFLRSLNLLEPPEAMLADPHLVATVLRCYQERDERPAEEPLGPPRAELVERLAPT